MRHRRSSWSLSWGGVGFAGRAVAIVAVALTTRATARAACPPPVLADCQRPAYLSGACGKETRVSCNALIHAAFLTESAKVTATKSALLPKSLVSEGGLATKQGVSNTVETAKIGPYSNSLQYARGMTAHYQGVVQDGTLFALSKTAFLPQITVERLSNQIAAATMIDPALLVVGPNLPPANPGPVPGNVPGLGNLALLGGGNLLSRFDNGTLGMLAGLLGQTVDKRTRWKADGARVRSCEEYVYQRYTTFSTYEDAAQQLGDNYPAIFDLAYLRGVGGGGGPLTPPEIVDATLAGKPIRDELGNVVTEIAFPPFSQRNPYYDWRPGSGHDTEYPTYAKTRYWDAHHTRLATLTSLLFDTDPWHWSWAEFRRVGVDYLARYNPDLLEELDARKFDFEQLLAKRRGLMQAYRSAWLAAIYKNVSCPNPKDPGHKRRGFDCGFSFDPTFLYPLDEDYGARLSELDALIDDAVAHAPTGCVYDRFSHGRNACDWSPHGFYRFLVDQMNPKRELDYQRCVAVTNNNFSVSGRLAEIKTKGVPDAGITPGDWNASSAKLTELIEKFRTYAEKLRKELPISSAPRGVPPIFGDDQADEESVGNGTFGAAYDYDVGWQVDGMGADGHVSDITVAARAKFTSSISLLGTKIAIVDAGASVAPNPADRDRFDEDLHFRVLDEDIYLPPVNDTTSEPVFNLVMTAANSPDLPEYAALVIIMGVPIKFSVGAAGSAAFSAGLHGELARHPDTDATKDSIEFQVAGGVTPKVVLSGFAAASIDLLIVEVGIKGELVVLSAELPLTMDVSIKTDDAGALTLKGKSQLDAVLRTLDGRLALFVKVFLLGSVEQNLVSWRGPQINQNLFKAEFGPLPLADVRNALNAAL